VNAALCAKRYFRSAPDTGLLCLCRTHCLAVRAAQQRVLIKACLRAVRQDAHHSCGSHNGVAKIAPAPTACRLQRYWVHVGAAELCGGHQLPARLGSALHWCATDFPQEHLQNMHWCQVLSKLQCHSGHHRRSFASDHQPDEDSS
jgi:hypothetical protein